MLSAAIQRLEAVSITPTTDLSDEAHSGSDNRSTVSSGDAHEAPREAEFPPLRDSSGIPLRPAPTHFSVWEKTSALECIKKQFGTPVPLPGRPGMPMPLPGRGTALRCAAAKPLGPNASVFEENESATVETLTVETETMTLDTESQPSGQAATPRPSTPASSLTATDSDVPNTPDYDGVSRPSQRCWTAPALPYVLPAHFLQPAQVIGAGFAPDLATKGVAQSGQMRDASPRSGSESSIASTASSPQWSTQWLNGMSKSSHKDVQPPIHHGMPAAPPVPPNLISPVSGWPGVVWMVPVPTVGPALPIPMMLAQASGQAVPAPLPTAGVDVPDRPACADQADAPGPRPGLCYASDRLSTEILSFRNAVKSYQNDKAGPGGKRALFVELLRQRIVACVPQEYKNNDKAVDVQVFGSVATELNLPWSDLDLVVSGIVPWYAKGALYEIAEAVDPTDDDGDAYRDPSAPLVAKPEPMDPRLRQMLGGKPAVIEARRLPLLQFYAVLPNEPPVQVELSIAGTQHSGLPAVPLVKQLCAGIPGLREIVLFVKRMLYMHHLNRPREGGLSSYGLLLMVAAFLKERPAHPLGEALVELCAFYGMVSARNIRVGMASTLVSGKGEKTFQPFSYATVAITVSDKATSPSFALRTGNEPLYIRDPLQLSANVAACTWRVQEVQTMFQNAYAYFTGVRGSCAASADDSDEPILPARQSPPQMQDDDSKTAQVHVLPGKLVNRKKGKTKKKGISSYGREIVEG